MINKIAWIREYREKHPECGLGDALKACNEVILRNPDMQPAYVKEYLALKETEGEAVARERYARCHRAIMEMYDDGFEGVEKLYVQLGVVRRVVFGMKG